MTSWEANPPIVCARDGIGDVAEVVGLLHERAILRSTTPDSAFTCTECGERRDLSYVPDAAGKDCAFICCSCGPSHIPDEFLRRWEIDTPRFLALIFRSIRLSIEERVAAHLWFVGRATWAGRAREVWFVRSFQRNGSGAVVQALKSHPKAILFTPTETSILQWQEKLPHLLVSLESTVELSGKELGLDTRLVESCVVDAVLNPAVPRARPQTPLRAVRASKIEKLTDYMNQHLRIAKDHAWGTKERTGMPELLPRPLQIELAEALEMSETDVSRCLDDPRAKELKICWEIAENLDQVMRWAGPLNRKRLKRRTGRKGTSRKRGTSSS